jgi:D-sedoheptulose 7-phosphate isomerase
VKGIESAKTKGMATIVLTGKGGGKLGEIADVCLAVPSTVTARIQESHSIIAHVICELVEEKFC